MAKFFSIGKTSLLIGKTPIFSQNLFNYWLNLNILAKPQQFLVKPLSLGKTFPLLN
jgi:hypothetical protein